MDAQPAHDDPVLSGLRERVEEPLVHAPFSLVLRIRLVDVGRGRSVLEMTVGGRCMNVHGGCHGGAIWTLADMAFGMAGACDGPIFEKTFGVQLLNSYGATEVCGSCAFESPSGLRRRGSVGAAIGSASIDIQDDEGNSLPPGSRGEIVVSGDTVGAGYWQDRDATTAAFTARGWRSGDLGELDENGLLYVLDRKKDLIITGGSNIFPSEVEAVLASHPAVKLAAVVGVPDALKGELAIGCVVPNDGATLSEEALLAYCKDRLAVYKIPRRIEFLQSVPLGPTGKILKRVLRDQIREEAAD